MKIKTFRPDQLPLHALKWESFIDLIGKAHATIARYDEIIMSVEQPQAVFSLLTYEEAIASVHSQNTSITLKEVLFYQAKLLVTHSRTDIEKILNYRKVLLDTAKKVTTHPISFVLLQKMHASIQRNKKKVQKEIGKFRSQQNWIGPEKCPIEEAYFYPPNIKILHRCLINLKKYLSYKEKDPLVQLAIFFAQLLIIHPFMDGNGRVGRMLIPMIFYKKKLTSLPMFYLSAYFKRNRIGYFQKLFTITAEGNWEEWIRFFLKGVIEEGQRRINQAKFILMLYHQCIAKVGDSESSKKVINQLFACPIMSQEKWERQKEKLHALRRLEGVKEIKLTSSQSMVALQKLLTIDRF